MSSLIISSGVVQVPGQFPVLTLDTRGATVIYMFGESVFGVGEPLPLHYDDQGNTWFLINNPFSSCNGGMNALRCFNPNISATHTFRVSGNATFGTSLIVIALAPSFSGESYVIRRQDSNVNPVRPGALTSVVSNYVMITGVVAGCGITASVDSGFSIVEATDRLAVALAVQSIPGLVNVTWSGLSNPITDRGGSVIEGFGIYNGSPPPPPGSNNTRIYEA